MLTREPGSGLAARTFILAQRMPAPSYADESHGPARALAYVGLGSNLGDSREILARAVHALTALPDVRLVGVSRLYRTRPVGVVEQPDFHNAVVELDVPDAVGRASGALALLLALKGIERAFGRQPRERWGPRELDLDLLLFGDAEIRITRAADAPGGDAGGSGWLLEVPHPGARERLFVLAPLADLALDLKPPGWGETVAAARDRRARDEGPDAVRAVAGWDADRGSWESERDAHGGSVHAIERRAPPEGFG